MRGARALPAGGGRGHTCPRRPGPDRPARKESRPPLPEDTLVAKTSVVQKPQPRRQQPTGREADVVKPGDAAELREQRPRQPCPVAATAGGRDRHPLTAWGGLPPTLRGGPCPGCGGPSEPTGGTPHSRPDSPLPRSAAPPSTLRPLPTRGPGPGHSPAAVVTVPPSPGPRAPCTSGF